MKSNFINHATYLRVLFCFAAVISACNGSRNDESDTTSSDQVDAFTTDGGGEIVAIPVYAVWKPRTENLRYDGLFDSVSRFFRLCQTREKRRIDDLSELSLRIDDDCYTQRTSLMIGNSSDSAPPLFLRVVHLDSINNKVIGISDQNDTIVTSINTMDARSLEILKSKYIKTLKESQDVKRVEKYYSPEKAVENQEKKERAIRNNVVRYKRLN